MNLNQRFLVALSNTDQDTALIEYAAMLARRRLGREFRFLHGASNRSSQPSEASLKQIEAALQERLAQHFGTPPAGETAACHVLPGEREDVLLEAATRWRCDVILLGHRRDRSGQRSLSRRMAMLAPSSVWLVPEGASPTIRNVLAPVDFSKHSADALETAAYVARRGLADRCQALHVYFDPSSVRYPENVEARRTSELAALTDFLAGLDLHGQQFETHVEEGASTSRAILHVAQQHGSDLIVMSTRGRSRAAAVLLGSITTQVMVESPVPVLAVKHFGAAMGLFQALTEGHWQRPIKSN